MDFNARLASRRDLHAGLAIFRVAYADGSVLDFEPGQFVSLGLPDPAHPERIARRAYSIASARGDPELEFFVRRVSAGSLTPELFSLAPGDPLWMDTRALGHFTLRGVPPTAHVVLVATGTGLGPFVSMVKSPGAGTRWERLAIVHGARTETDLGYRAELEALAGAEPRVRYLPILSREVDESGWRGARGHVQDLLRSPAWPDLAGFPLEEARVHVLLCGNPDMILDVTALLEERGFRRHRRSEPGNIRSERYW